MDTPLGTTWQRIARDIANRILSGETPVGTKIASHQQLIQRHGASLGTIKRALEHLQDAGVLQGVQGSGVFVRRIPRQEDLGFDAPSPQDRGGDVASLREELNGLRTQMNRLDDSTTERLTEFAQSLTGLESSGGDLRELVGVLQAHLIELYARMGQPYPHGASGDQRKDARLGRRRTAGGTA